MNRRTGATAVEFAICAPVLLLLVMGAFEVSHVALLQHAAESAAYEGARAGVILGAKTDRCEKAASVVLNSLGVKKYKIDTHPGKIKPDDKTIEVEITIPLRDNTVFAPFFFSKNLKFIGKCELVRETL
jgi:Flp pilus assembly protein TadG